MKLNKYYLLIIIKKVIDFLATNIKYDTYLQYRDSSILIDG